MKKQLDETIKLLMLEDNPDDAELIRRTLISSPLAFEILQVNSGPAFINALDTFSPNFILSDHQLPDFSSVKALLTSRSKFPHIPFILVTGTVSDEVASSIIQGGADDYILKGNLNRLPTAIQQAIDKKKVEESLYRSETNLRSIFDNSDTAFILVDPSFNLISANRLAISWAETVMQRQMMIGDNLYDLAQDQDFWHIDSLKDLVKGEPIEYETRVRGQRGMLWYHVRLLPVKDKENNFGGASIAISDITRRKNLEREQRSAERALIKAHEHLLFHLENAPLGFIEWNSSGRVKSWSKQAEEIFGWNEREMIGSTWNGLTEPYHEDSHSAAKVFELFTDPNILRNQIQHRNTTKAGEIIWCEWFNSVQLNKRGEVTTILSLVRDVSDQKKAEFQREFDQNNLKALINNTNDLMWSVDQDLKLITFNQAFAENVKRRLNQTPVTGQLVDSNRYPDAVRERYRVFYARALSGETFSEIEYTDIPEETWAEISFYPIRQKAAVIGTACYSRDITPRVLAEREVATREKRFRALIENSSDAIVLTNEEFQIVYQSPSVTRILGFQAGENGAARVLENVHPDDLHLLVEVRERVMRQPAKPISFQYRTRHKNGNYVWLEVVLTNLLAEPAVGAFVANYRDITERKNAEQNLELTLRRFEQAQKIARLGHWEVNFETQRTTWSDEIFRIYGIQPGTVVPSLELFLNYIDPTELEDVKAILDKGIQSQKSFSFFHRFRRETGMERNLFSVVEFEFEKGTPIGLYGISLDVTELAEKERDLEHANKELATFIYKTYHDLRAPIASILGMVNVANAEPDDNHSRAYFNTIGEIAHKQNRMLHNLANVMTVRNRELLYESFDVTPMIFEILHRLSSHPESARIDVQVNNRLPVRLVSDRELIYEILFQLIENAILYHDPERADPKIHVNLELESPDTIRIGVEDNGTGMPLEVKEKIFDMFYRGNIASKGSGLGLYFVKSAVEKLKGKLTVDTAENRGTAFILTIPFATQAAE